MSMPKEGEKILSCHHAGRTVCDLMALDVPKLIMNEKTGEHANVSFMMLCKVCSAEWNGGGQVDLMVALFKGQA